MLGSPLLCRPKTWVGLCLLLVALGSCGREGPDPAPAPRVMSRFGLEEIQHGRVLLGELGCVACHTDSEASRAAPRRGGPRLGSAAAGLGASLDAFLAAPRTELTGTVMPDLLGQRPRDEREQIGRELAAFLRTLADADLPPAPPYDPAAAERGAELFGRIGCVACHATGEAAATAGKLPLDRLGRRYHRGTLQAFLLEPHAERPQGRMPDFGLTPQEAWDLAHHLLGEGVPSPEPAPEDSEALAAAGAEHFAQLGCVACHDDVEVAEVPATATHRRAAPLADLDPMRGCLAEQRGDAPWYDLDPSQRAALRAALAAEAPSPAERLLAEFAAQGCLACHERDGVGGPSGAELESFTGDQPALGVPGRVPPPLTGVGAKLQESWLEDTLAHGSALDGHRVRPYLHTRMPGFGVATARRLTEQLLVTDPAEALQLPPLPENRKEAGKVRDLGRELVGSKGMSCTACHAWAGEHSGEMAAVDLVATTALRLRPSWFHAFVLNPQAYRSEAVMPQYFPGGKTTRPEFADGDTTAQIAALWHCLAAGRNQRRPAGLRPDPIELAVGNEAVMLRRAVRNTGKRGISVGLPREDDAQGVNYTFDAETLALTQVWWGRFLDVGPVWHGQGSGQAQIPSRDHGVLGRGPAFAVMPAIDTPWPELARHERGQRLSGYDLDASRRPTFRYAAADLEVSDKLWTATDEAGGRPFLRRELSFRGTGWSGPGMRVLRLASGEKITLVDGVARIGSRLTVAVPAGAVVVAGPEEGQSELRVPVEVNGVGPDRTGSLTIDYRWEDR